MSDRKDKSSQSWIRHIPTWLLKNIMLMTTGGLVLLVLITGVGVLRTGSRFFAGLDALFNAPPSEPQVDVRSLVVTQVRGASELTTAVFTMEAVVPTRQDRKIGNYTLGSTTLLYIAHGEVRAGVDLGELDKNDVMFVNDTVQIQLPPPRILDSKIDVTRSQVYDYDRGFLNLGPDAAPQLQTLAQQETLKKIVANACREDLLQEANDRAQLVVSQLLSTAGYQAVEVKTQPPTPETCLPS